jgi:hypothetical protein
MPLRGSSPSAGGDEGDDDVGGVAVVPAEPVVVSGRGHVADKLRLFGFPPPGRSYWTDTALDGVAQRYRGLSPEPSRCSQPNRR